MTIDPQALGATLYVPATRDGLPEIVAGTRLPGLRSTILCLEDSIRADEVPFALARLAALLARPRSAGGPHLFVRPRDPAMLAQLLAMPGIAQVDGFVLPKVTADSLPAWLAPLAAQHDHLLMPTLETREAFDAHEMRRLREQLLAVQERVLAIRIGGNDLLQLLGTRRARGRTLYEGPIGPLVASLVGGFAPWGFALAAPVFETIDDPALLAEEVAIDIDHGLVTKTAIHPAQIATIEAGYRVGADALAEARAILALDAPAVFAGRGAMIEPATHRGWAERTVRRAAIFGTVPTGAAVASVA